MIYRWTGSKVVKLLLGRAFAGDPSLMMKLTSRDVSFTFPGRSTFGTKLSGREPLRQWLDRFNEVNPTFEVRDVVVSGPPWNMTVAVRFHDSVGLDYDNEGVDWIRIVNGQVRSIEVFLDTERVSEWEDRHPELKEIKKERLTAL